MDDRRTPVIARDPTQVRAYAALVKQPPSHFRWCATVDDLRGYDPMMTDVIAYGADMPQFCTDLIRFAKQRGHKVHFKVE
jgi:hypothetical protein